MPDPVFGEKVCVYAELVDSPRLDLPALVEHLLAQGVSKELLPERLDRGRRTAAIVRRQDRQRPTSRGSFEPGWRPSMNAPRRAARRPGGVGAVEGAPDRRRPVRRAGARRRLPPPRPTIGFAENMAGHITWQPDGQTDMYVNPWGLWWQELTASDICVVDERRAGGPRTLGRHARHPHPHRTAPGPRPTPAW